MRLAGRLAGIRDGRAQFSGSLRNKCELADLKLGRLLDTIDEWATANGLDDSVPPPQRCAPTTVAEPPLLGLDLGSGEIRTIIWATGFSVDYGWLEVDAFDEGGRPRHQRGISSEPGVYFLGLPWQTRRGSSFIWGVWHDARLLADRISTHRNYLLHYESRKNRPETT